MDEAWTQALVEDAAAIGVAVTAESAAAMAKHVDLLLTWNAKINLTRIVAIDEIRAKHCIDSLGALPLVPASVTSVLDMGAGAGFPGIPWLCVRPGLRLTMVDAVAKKVGFLKTALATLRLSGGKALHARLEGQLDRENLEAVDMVVSRAFMDLARVLQLARPYLAPTGSSQCLAHAKPPTTRIASRRP
jgi:16S rRNA (guanine527-N7)-methyltransferase